MDFENKDQERGDWREERRKWRAERRNQFRDFREARHHSRGGRIWVGLVILGIGVVSLLKVALFPIPAWVYDWPMILIVVGFFSGIGHKFRGGFWFVLMLIGGVFLIRNNFPDLVMYKYLWPGALILLGLFFILKPRHRDWHREHKNETSGETNTEASNSNTTLKEDTIDSTSIFGGIKKNILSKNFKGGDITNIMGGSEIDLSQADINGTAVIDLTQVFGGTKLIVPSNWQVKTQMAAIFGGVEDKRTLQHSAFDPNKILILDGTSIFGGIEIRSY
jgi:predicted membrane protein